MTTRPTAQKITMAALCLASVLSASTATYAQSNCGIGARPCREPAVERDRNIEVCFFTEVKFKQSHFCVGTERRTAFVEDIWKDRIESITVKNASLKICNEAKMRGECMYLSHDRAELPEDFFDQVYSFRVK